MLYPLHWVLSLLASVLRLGAGRGGVSRVTNAARPTLYEFEGCPFCKIAREAISEAGASLLVRPCPKLGTRFRPSVVEHGGKAQFPYLVDGDAGEGLYESRAIAALMRQDGGTRPLVHWLGPINTMLAQYSILLRLTNGTRAMPSNYNEKPLEFFGSEVNPSARLVKEHLCALELEYVWHTGQGDGVRLLDPNTGDELFGGRAAIAHLKRVYRKAK